MGLTKRVGVISNDNIDKVLDELNDYMNNHDKWKDFNIEVTSCVRTPLSQLIIIHAYAMKKNILSEFPEFDSTDVDKKTVIDGKELFCWQRVWSRLLHLGIIINPCYAAECLEDYIVDGVNKKGHIIQQSTHIAGRAFDISGNAGMDKIKLLIMEAMADGVGISSYMVERENNCFHNNIKVE